MAHVLSSKNEQITLGYGRTTLNGSPYNHTGIDLVKNHNQLDGVIAAQKGKVIAVRKDIKGFLNNSYGNYVKLQHNDGYETLYCHLAPNSVKVNVGDIVEAGQEIGYMGATGMAFGAHLHFEMRVNGSTVDPKPYLDGKEIPAYAEKPATPEAPAQWVDYKIVSGDTLNAIASKRGTTATEIQKYNPIIVDINKIQAGWVIKVPEVVNQPLQPGDNVVVNGIGYAASDGTGGQTGYRTNQGMKLVKVVQGAKYPYGCNQNNNMNGITAYWADVRKQ